MGSDTRIEEIRARDAAIWSLRHVQAEQAEIDRHALLAEIDQIEAYGREYIERTDPALSCDYWFEDELKVPSQRCGTCRACALDEIDRLKAELAEYIKSYETDDNTYYGMTAKEYSGVWQGWHAEIDRLKTENARLSDEAIDRAAELAKAREKIDRWYNRHPPGISAREAARRHFALDGADAQALEGALQQVERELARARELLDKAIKAARENGARADQNRDDKIPFALTAAGVATEDERQRIVEKIKRLPHYTCTGLKTVNQHPDGPFVSDGAAIAAIEETTP